jgi:hypothetical protein
MTGLGIIDGVSDNTLKPDGNFTRAQAAKIITYMLLGTKAGEALGDKTVAESARKFSDYTYNTQWAIPYVEYCADRGIIEGYEDGNFYPNRLVSSTEWLKMLVCALGYDASKFTGKDWAQNSYDAAIAYHIITAEEFALDFDRETAILYAYNALTSKYADGFSEHSLAERVFDLKEATYTYDNYGAPTSKDFYAGTTKVASIEITAGKTPNGTAKVDKKATTTKYIVDGVDVTESSADKASLGGNSASVAVYEKYNGSETRVVVVNTLVAVMDKTNVEKFSKVAGEDLKIGDVVIYTQGNTDGKDLKGTATIETAQRVTAVPGTVTDIDRTNKWVNVDGVKKVFAAKYPGDPAALATNVKYNFYYDNYGNIIYVTEYTEPAREGTLVFLLNSVYDDVLDTSNAWAPAHNTTYQAKYIDLSDATIETVDVNTIEGVTTTPADVDDETFHTYSTKAYNRYYWAYENEDGTVDFAPYQVATKSGLKNVTYGTATINEVANSKPTVTLKGKVTMGYDSTVDASGERNFTTDSDTKLTVITYTGAFENLQITTTTGYSNFKAAEYTAVNTFATSVSIATNVSPTDIYVITPASAPEQTYAYMMYVGEGVDHAEGGQEYYFVDSYGVKQTLTYDQIPDFENTNPSDGIALVEGTVYKLTLDSADVFTAVATVPEGSIKTGTVVKADKAGYLSLDKISTYYVYSAFYGGQPLASDGSKAQITVKGTDVHGCAVAGSNVALYLDEAGQIVFVTVAK